MWPFFCTSHSSSNNRLLITPHTQNPVINSWRILELTQSFPFSSSHLLLPIVRLLEGTPAMWGLKNFMPMCSVSCNSTACSLLWMFTIYTECCLHLCYFCSGAYHAHFSFSPSQLLTSLHGRCPPYPSCRICLHTISTVASLLLYAAFSRIHYHSLWTQTHRIRICTQDKQYDRRAMFYWGSS